LIYFNPALSPYFDLIFVHNAENMSSKTPYNPHKQRDFARFRISVKHELDCENIFPMLNYNQSIFPENQAAAILTI